MTNLQSKSHFIQISNLYLNSKKIAPLIISQIPKNCNGIYTIKLIIRVTNEHIMIKYTFTPKCNFQRKK